MTAILPTGGPQEGSGIRFDKATFPQPFEAFSTKLGQNFPETGSSHGQGRGGKAAQQFIASKIKLVMKEGVKGKKASQDQAVAIALSEARKHGFKVGKAMKIGKNSVHIIPVQLEEDEAQAAPAQVAPSMLRAESAQAIQERISHVVKNLF